MQIGILVKKKKKNVLILIDEPTKRVVLSKMNKSLCVSLFGSLFIACHSSA